jgi:hypothetical protein
MSKAENQSGLINELLDRLEDYHGEGVSWHREQNSDADTLADELRDLGDDEWLEWAFENC